MRWDEMRWVSSHLLLSISLIFSADFLLYYMWCEGAHTQSEITALSFMIQEVQPHTPQPISVTQHLHANTTSISLCVVSVLVKSSWRAAVSTLFSWLSWDDEWNDSCAPEEALMCIVSHYILYVGEYEGEKKKIYYAVDDERNVETKVIVPTECVNLFLFCVFGSQHTDDKGGGWLWGKIKVMQQRASRVKTEVKKVTKVLAIFTLKWNYP